MSDRWANAEQGWVSTVLCVWVGGVMCVQEGVGHLGHVSLDMGNRWGQGCDQREECML